MPKILLIENEPILAEIYQDKFQSEGIKTEVVANTANALLYLKKNKPDLVLLDLMLPRLEGLELLREIRKQQLVPETPIIVFTVYEMEPAMQEAHRLGAKHYLIKTRYTPSEVVLKIRQYLKKSS